MLLLVPRTILDAASLLNRSIVWGRSIVVKNTIERRCTSTSSAVVNKQDNQCKLFKTSKGMEGSHYKEVSFNTCYSSIVLC